MNRVIQWPGKALRTFAGRFGIGLWIIGILPGILQAQKVAEGGSPLYSFTVRESLAGLKSSGKEKSASEGQVCPNCGKVHAVAVPNAANPVAVAPLPEASAQGQVCPVCGKVHPPAQTSGHTNTAVMGGGASPSVATIAGKYYYCAKCRVYHQAQPNPIVPQLPYLGALKPASSDTNTVFNSH